MLVDFILVGAFGALVAYAYVFVKKLIDNQY